MKMVVALNQFEVIMGESFRMLDLRGSVRSMGYHTPFQPLGLPNKTV